MKWHDAKKEIPDEDELTLFWGKSMDKDVYREAITGFLQEESFRDGKKYWYIKVDPNENWLVAYSCCDYWCYLKDIPLPKDMP